MGLTVELANTMLSSNRIPYQLIPVQGGYHVQKVTIPLTTIQQRNRAHVAEYLKTHTLFSKTEFVQHMNAKGLMIHLNSYLHDIIDGYMVRPLGTGTDWFESCKITVSV